jgi:hypothetical protein
MALARKVQLTAFQGQLVGKAMDWPAEMIGQDIYLVMDMEMPSYETEKASSIKVYESTPKKCRFQFTGGYSMAGDMPAIYKLVEVSS